MDLLTLQRTAWDIARSKGLHEDFDSLPLRAATLIRLAFVMTEVSEATQIVKRHGVSLDDLVVQVVLAEELADIVIRVCELAQGLEIDLSWAVEQKMAKNLLRPQKYGTPWEEGNTNALP